MRPVDPNISDDDATEVRRLLDYDAATGVFVWRVDRCKQVPAGTVAGSPSANGYSLIRFRGKTHYAHRLAWLHVYGRMPENDIDHLNGVRSDNRIANLRDVSRTVNMQNQRKARTNNRCGVLGVTRNEKTGRCVAQIQADGRGRYLGSFGTPEEAHQAYLEAKRQFHIGATI
jgi:hypothetical protein